MERRTSWAELEGPLHYVEWTGDGEGPPFLLVHGLGGSHLNWVCLAPLLSERGRVIALDLPGFGWTPLERRRAALFDNARLLSRFVDEVIGEPAVLVGNSMGGLLSTLVAAGSPEHVRGLVLVDPALAGVAAQVDPRIAGAFAAMMLPAVGERLMRARVRLIGYERIARETLEMCTVDPGRVDPVCVEAHIAMAKERVRMPWATTAFVQAVRSLVPAIMRPRRVERMLRDVSAPTLLMMGALDRLVPVAAAEVVSRIRPDWDYVVLDDLGHAPQLEDPRAVMDAIEGWLDGPASWLLTGRPGSITPPPDVAA